MNPFEVTDMLVKRLNKLRFDAPVTHVYNPLDYAAAPHKRYLELYGMDRRRVLLLGMNPGPWGMAQTGVPFGEVSMVRDWMGVEAPVRPPKNEHPKRPILGFDCPRSEVSGARLWGWARKRFGSPKSFFQRFFVVNYCPLSFMEESGKNRTPDKLHAEERHAIYEICDESLRHLARYYEPEIVIGVGRFAEERALHALKDLDVEVGRVLHPSPANPQANKDWAKAAEKTLSQYGVLD